MNVLSVGLFFAVVFVLVSNPIYSKGFDWLTTWLGFRIPIPTEIPWEYALANAVLIFVFTSAVLWRVTVTAPKVPSAPTAATAARQGVVQERVQQSSVEIDLDETNE